MLPIERQEALPITPIQIVFIFGRKAKIFMKFVKCVPLCISYKVTNFAKNIKINYYDSLIDCRGLVSVSHSIRKRGMCPSTWVHHKS